MNYDQQIAFILYIQHYVWLAPIMQLATAIGSVEFYLLIVSAIYWCIDSSLGFRLGLILMLSQGMNDSLKIAFHSPRPYWISSKVIAFAGYGSFGIPSGHSQNAVCIWGYIASALKNAPAWLAAFLLVIIIGISRIYLGAHFPIDVVVGWATGAIILIAFIKLEQRAAAFLKDISLPRQSFVSFMASACLLAFYYISFVALGSWQVPSSWDKGAVAAIGLTIDPLNHKDILGSGGTVFGIGAGYSWLRRRYEFSARGPLAIRAMRYLLGIAGFGLIWYGFGAVGLHQTLLISYILDYLGAMFAGIWMAAAAPILFIRAGLAEKET